MVQRADQLAVDGLRGHHLLVESPVLEDDVERELVGPAFLLRMTLAMSVSLQPMVLCSERDRLDRKEGARVGDLEEVVEAEAVDLAALEVRGRVGEGEVAGGGDPARVAVVQHRRAGEAADGVGEFLCIGDGLDDDPELVPGSWRGSRAPMTPFLPYRWNRRW